VGPALISAGPKFGDELFQLLACFERFRVVRVVVVSDPDNAVSVCTLVLTGACGGVVFPEFFSHVVDVSRHRARAYWKGDSAKAQYM